MFVFCGGMFRSGSTLQYQIVSQLIEDKGLGSRITWHAPDDFSEIRSLHSGSSQMLAFKAHKLTSEMLEEIEENGALVITVHRDIRDVVVSAMKKNDWSFRKIWRNDRLRYWTGRFDEWARQPGALICRYEDLVKDLHCVIEKIANHLGISLSRAEIESLAQEYSLENQKLRANQVAMQLQMSSNSGKYDPHSLLHYNHIAAGGIGEYRDILLPAQIRAIEDECNEWMMRWGYEADRPQLTLSQRALRMTYRR